MLSHNRSKLSAVGASNLPGLSPQQVFALNCQAVKRGLVLSKKQIVQEETITYDAINPKERTSLITKIYRLPGKENNPLAKIFTDSDGIKHVIYYPGSDNPNFDPERQKELPLHLIISAVDSVIEVQQGSLTQTTQSKFKTKKYLTVCSMPKNPLAEPHFVTISPEGDVINSKGWPNGLLSDPDMDYLAATLNANGRTLNKKIQYLGKQAFYDIHSCGYWIAGIHQYFAQNTPPSSSGLAKIELDPYLPGYSPNFYQARRTHEVPKHISDIPPGTILIQTTENKTNPFRVHNLTAYWVENSELKSKHLTAEQFTNVEYALICKPLFETAKIDSKLPSITPGLTVLNLIINKFGCAPTVTTNQKKNNLAQNANVDVDGSQDPDPALDFEKTPTTKQQKKSASQQTLQTVETLKGKLVLPKFESKNDQYEVIKTAKQQILMDAIEWAEKKYLNNNNSTGISMINKISRRTENAWEQVVGICAARLSSGFLGCLASYRRSNKIGDGRDPKVDLFYRAIVNYNRALEAIEKNHVPGNRFFNDVGLCNLTSIRNLDDLLTVQKKLDAIEYCKKQIRHNESYKGFTFIKDGFLQGLPAKNWDPLPRFSLSSPCLYTLKRDRRIINIYTTLITNLKNSLSKHEVNANGVIATTLKIPVNISGSIAEKIDFASTYKKPASPRTSSGSSSDVENDVSGDESDSDAANSPPLVRNSPGK